MNYLDITFKLVLGLLALITVINLTGKGNLAPTTAMEQIQNYVLGGIIGGVIYSKDLHVFQFGIVLTIFKSKNHFLQRILDGTPRVLIVNGNVDVAACNAAKITAQELTFKLRMHNVFNITHVKRAVLEQNGQLLVVLSGEENPRYPLITDGTIQKNILAAIDKDEDWLMKKLTEQGYSSSSEIFLADYLSGNVVITPYRSA